MRTLCPNLDKADGLETVLEVPIPEEMFNNMGSNAALQWRNMRNLMRAQSADTYSSSSYHAVVSSNDQFIFLFKIVGSALVPFQARLDHIADNMPVRNGSMGLDPRSTANLFLNAICVREKTIKDEEYFILKLESSIDMLKAQSTTNLEVVHHTILGYFSQRTGLLIQFEDTKLVRLKSPKGDSNVFWETSMESMLEDYRYIEGINIAHNGKTATIIYRYGKNIDYRANIEETWMIEEIDFNIYGLPMDCFLPPAEFEEQGMGC